ncbi:MAG: hypothetical protein RR540_05965 [Oscillospiraceae bacterium]
MTCDLSKAFQSSHFSTAVTNDVVFQKTSRPVSEGITSIRVFPARCQMHSNRIFAEFLSDSSENSPCEVIIPSHIISYAKKHDYDKWFVEIEWFTPDCVTSCSISDDNSIIYSGNIYCGSHKVHYFTNTFLSEKNFAITVYFKENSDKTYTGKIVNELI